MGKLWRMRDQDGVIREFEPHAKRPGLWVGHGGWTAQFGKKGEITVRTPSNIEPNLVYHFQNGQLTEAEIDGKRCRFSYPEPLVYESSRIVPLWPEASEDAIEVFQDQMSKKWNFGNRLKLGFSSPNQAAAVLAMLFLACLSLALGCTRLLGRLAASFFGVVFLVGLLLTASRGGLVAVVAGAIPLWVCHLKKIGRLSVRTVIIASLGVLLVVGGLLGFSYVKVRTAQGDKASDSIRLELLRRTPRMWCDAPTGWGSVNAVGRAYTDWYQPQESHRRMFSLVNDHLSSLVALGWFKGGAYIFLWIAGLFALWLLAWRGGSPIPAVAWTALGVTAAFNVVLYVQYVSWFALATLLLAVCDRRLWNLRFWKGPLIVGLIGTALVVFGLYLASIVVRVDAIPLCHTGERTILNGSETKIWLVADPDILGPISYKKEMRAFYEQVKGAPAMGFVSCLEDLPTKGVDRLVLSGKWGEAFLEDYKAGRIRQLPSELVFLAPQFGSSQIPDSLRARVRVHIVIGEFAARYFEDYAIMQPQVVLVPGAECYIPGWMRFCVGEYEVRR